MSEHLVATFNAAYIVYDYDKQKRRRILGIKGEGANGNAFIPLRHAREFAETLLRVIDKCDKYNMSLSGSGRGMTGYTKVDHTRHQLIIDEAKMGNSQTIDEFLLSDPSARYVLQNAAAERRLRERDNLPKHLAATVVHYGGHREVKIIDDNEIAHIESVADAPTDVKGV